MLNVPFEGECKAIWYIKVSRRTKRKRSAEWRATFADTNLLRINVAAHLCHIFSTDTAIKWLNSSAGHLQSSHRVLTVEFSYGPVLEPASSAVVESVYRIINSRHFNNRIQQHNARNYLSHCDIPLRYFTAVFHCDISLLQCVEVNQSFSYHWYSKIEGDVSRVLR